MYFRLDLAHLNVLQKGGRCLRSWKRAGGSLIKSIIICCGWQWYIDIIIMKGKGPSERDIYDSVSLFVRVLLVERH